MVQVDLSRRMLGTQSSEWRKKKNKPSQRASVPGAVPCSAATQRSGGLAGTAATARLALALVVMHRVKGPGDQSRTGFLLIRPPPLGHARVTSCSL